MTHIKLFILVFLLSSSALAWGPTGHRVVGEIAQRHLNPLAAKQIQDLLDGRSLAEVSNWADEIRNTPEFDPFKPLHYVDILPKFSSWEEKMAAQDQPDPKGDVVVAILTISEFLRTNDSKVFIPIPALAKIDRATAVKLLVHFVGDIHQPLHVIDGLGPDGKSIHGGNSIEVNWMGRWNSNLHSIWDDEMIDHENLSYEEMATYVDHSSLEELRLWNNSQVATWADENLKYREQIF